MLGVMLLTYNRLEYATRTLGAIGARLKASEDIWVHIADDGSSQEYRDLLYKLAKQFWGDHTSITNSERRGYGANYNIGTQALHGICDIILPLEDDWELTRELDLDPLAKILREDRRVGCLRLGYLGFTQPIRAEFIHSQGQTLALLDPASPEPHVFAGHPRLETRDFERRVGPWPEELLAGATEFEVAHRTEARQGVAWPVDLVRPSGDLFAHIGTSPSDEPIYEKEEAHA